MGPITIIHNFFIQTWRQNLFWFDFIRVDQWYHLFTGKRQWFEFLRHLTWWWALPMQIPGTCSMYGDFTRINCHKMTLNSEKNRNHWYKGLRQVAVLDYEHWAMNFGLNHSRVKHLVQGSAMKYSLYCNKVTV